MLNNLLSFYKNERRRHSVVYCGCVGSSSVFCAFYFVGLEKTNEEKDRRLNRL